jgi:hypothetical protein
MGIEKLRSRSGNIDRLGPNAQGGRRSSQRRLRQRDDEPRWRASRVGRHGRAIVAPRASHAVPKRARGRKRWLPLRHLSSRQAALQPELRSSIRKLKPLPPDPFRHQDSAIAPDRPSDPSLPPDDGNCKSEPCLECRHAPTAGNIGTPRAGSPEIAFIKTHSPMVLAGELMATGGASRWRGIRWGPQFRDQAQDVSE